MAINYIKDNKYDDDSICFNPTGIWTKDGPIKFFAQETDDPKIMGGSINNLFNFLISLSTLSTLCDFCLKKGSGSVKIFLIVIEVLY